MSHVATTLAATIHDVDGRLVPAIYRLAPALREIFSAIALNISDATAPAVAAAAREQLGAATIIHAQGEAIIGRARRDAIRLALDATASQILYSDFDHALRWIEGAPDELRAALASQPDTAFLVVGRSPRAFAAEPQRLQQTERVVNHIHTLMTNRDWDLMAAIRRFSRPAAELIVNRSTVDTIGNDVEWPLLAERAGLTLGYATSDAFSYRMMEEFGAPADSGDADPANWIKRIDYAATHAAAMKPFLR